jgi:hypothetical protein
MMPHSPLKIMRPIWAITALLLIPGFFQGCGGVKEKKLEREGLTLIYRPKHQAAAAIEKMRLNHPIKISEEEFQNHLYSLQYEELFLLGKNKYVISLQDVSKISKDLTKAVNHLTPENILVFELDTPRGTTLGKIFATENKINFRFHSIKGADFSSNSLARSTASVWRLVPVKGQILKTTKRILGTSTLGDWIVAEMTLPQKTRRLLKGRKTKSQTPRPSQPSPSPQPVPRAPSGDNNQDLEKKLKFLKDLRSKDLIDDEEYEKKRKELLDSFL